jgi:hypothetical protein
MASRRTAERPVNGSNTAPCVNLQPRLLFKTQPENFTFPESPVEGTYERAPHLRALQSREAPGRDSRHLQAQPQA